MMIIIGIIAAIVVLVITFLIFIGNIILAKKTFFCAFPRLAVDGDPNKLRYIHLNGFFFIISNDIAGKDIVYQNEASNMMFQYNLKPMMQATEILNSKKDLVIEMLDVVSNRQMSYVVPHSQKTQAIKFFTRYRELMNRINRHKVSGR